MYHDIGCTQFSFVQCNGDAQLHCWGSNYCFTSKRNDACDYGLHLEAHNNTKVTLRNAISSSSSSYHDAVQRAANSSHLPPLHSCVVWGLIVGILLRHPRLCDEKLNNYFRLLILIFVFTVYK